MYQYPDVSHSTHKFLFSVSVFDNFLVSVSVPVPVSASSASVYAPALGPVAVAVPISVSLSPCLCLRMSLSLSLPLCTQQSRGGEGESEKEDSLPHILPPQPPLLLALSLSPLHLKGGKGGCCLGASAAVASA